MQKYNKGRKKRAFGYYMIMEKLSLNIANEHLRLMTKENNWDEHYLDDES